MHAQLLRGLHSRAQPLIEFLDITMFFETAKGMRPAPLKHNPFNAIVCPRPIAWVSTVSSTGIVNLAPFSYFNAVSSDPPCVMFAPNGAAPDTRKDTYRNVCEVAEFVVSLVSEALAAPMNETSASFSFDVDEFEQCGIEAAPSRLVQPPRVAASKAALECRVCALLELPRGKDGRQSHVVVGEVVGIHIDDSVIVDGVVDEARLKPLSRLGAFNYATLGQILEIPRPD
jgi:flavin reductase (DIM6/NTAB) family NADH-FMN oxidoreductase RutF